MTFQKILPVYETERIARKLIKNNSKISCWPLLFLIAVSRHSGWVKASDIISALRGNKRITQIQYYLDPVMEFLDLELRQDDKYTSQFPTRFVKIRDNCLDRVAIDSLDGLLTQTIFNKVTEFMQLYSHTSPIIYLLYIAIKVRKISDTKDIYLYIGSNDTVSRRIIQKLANMGHLHIMKAGVYRNAKVLIFEVE